jgi:predicted ester cyclase
MRIEDQNKQLVRELVRVVWTNGDLSRLPDVWTDDCVNHSAAPNGTVGQSALRQYHEGFLTGFLPSLSDPIIEFLQQVAEGDRVVSQMRLRAIHTGPLLGFPASGKSVVLSSIRIDRFEAGKIAEHWSIADMAGFTQQLQR